MNARPYDPLVEYYRDRLAAPHPEIPGWRRYYGQLGARYQQDVTNLVLPAALALQLHADGTLADVSVEPSTSGRGAHVFTRSPVTFRITRDDGSVVDRSRPPDVPCPGCGQMIPPMMSDGGYAPEGFTPEYDYYWCDACGDAFDFDEVQP